MLLVLQGREVQELCSRLTAADSANRILARQEREALDQAQAAVAEAQRARDALTPATIEIRWVQCYSHPGCCFAEGGWAVHALSRARSTPNQDLRPLLSVTHHDVHLLLLCAVI